MKRLRSYTNKYNWVVILINILNSIVKLYSTELGPGKKIIDLLRINKAAPFLLLLFIIEAILFIWSVQQSNIVKSISFFAIYIFTILLSSYWYSKIIEKSYGSIKEFDLGRINKFVNKVKSKLNICLNTIDENLIVENLVKERIESINRINQGKKTRNIGLFTITVPYLISIFRDNSNNLEFITLSIMIFGIILTIFSFRYALNDFNTLSKLMEISELLKELRLQSHIVNRNYESSLYINPIEQINYLDRMSLLNQEIQFLWKYKNNINRNKK